jgi:hypothetical protein
MCAQVLEPGLPVLWRMKELEDLILSFSAIFLNVTELLQKDAENAVRIADHREKLENTIL